MKMKTNVKATGASLNHNQQALRVKTNVKAGRTGSSLNHNQTIR